MSYARDEWLVQNGDASEGDRVSCQGVEYDVLSVRDEMAWVRRVDTGADYLVPKRRLTKAACPP